ncbi:MAG: nucleotide exchange factor GrpE [Gammaproteobacteria bacterium]|nr:nucleotide exchange factor GrpE [Gammaproteobacteria bacterium]MCP4473483.1 nucleotide exchange factor GrpE [Gammaproteobacteria bacterium]
MSDKKTDKQSLYNRLGGQRGREEGIIFDEEEEGESGSEGGGDDGLASPGEASMTESEQTVEFEQQLAEKHEQLLRAHAEMQNLRRRMDKETMQARKFAVEKFVNDLLPVIDSLEKACEHAYSHPDAKVIHDGIDLTLKMFLTCLQNSGVEVVDPADDLFNPEYHEAMTMIEKAGAEKNSILEVLQKGYLLNGRLIRPARVIIAK